MSTIPDDSSLEKRVRALAARLLEQGRRLATAESCTGGWIAKCCTDQPGSSAWFERGFVSYSDAAKHDALGVDAQVLQFAGAVSEAVARQMAAGALAHSAADVALAVTGIAGPDGGSEEKPVGTVWFAWDVAGTVESECMVFAGDRDAVRRQAVAHALDGLAARL
jgi:nicotinamide-nucleotide amidase